MLEVMGGAFKHEACHDLRFREHDKLQFWSDQLHKEEGERMVKKGLLTASNIMDTRN